MIYGVCEALLYTLRLYDTAFFHHKRHAGKHGHGHKHGHKQVKEAESGRKLISHFESGSDSTNTTSITYTSRYLAGSSSTTGKKGTTEKTAGKKKDVKEAFNGDTSKSNSGSGGGKSGSTVSKAFQKSDQKVSQYQAIMSEVTKAIETAQNSDLFLVRKLAQWVQRMNTSSHHDFPYDSSLTCPTGSFSAQQDSPAPKSSRRLEEAESGAEESPSESESESESENSEPARVCQQCRPHDIPLKQLPEILGIKLNLAKFNVSSRSLSSKTVKLKNGVLVPRLGFGCGMLAGVGSEAEETMFNAIKAGYRHFDTAQGYGTFISTTAAITSPYSYDEFMFIFLLYFYLYTYIYPIALNTMYVQATRPNWVER